MNHLIGIIKNTEQLKLMGKNKSLITHFCWVLPLSNLPNFKFNRHFLYIVT